ncbi:MAG: ABC transporter permease subunit [Propionibacteriaceae bacterium]|nr:ABC transporter permease subunit [Propionibacteriaceae bacterium]
MNPFGLKGTPLPELPGLLLPALGETLALVLLVLAVALIVGTPLAFLVYNLSPFGLFPRPRLYGPLSAVINLARSLPFLVLMAAVIPFTRLVMGTSLGIAGAVIPLSLGAIPLYARLVESTLRNLGVEPVEVARAFGATKTQAMLRVQFHESVPGIISNLTIAVVGIVDYTAVAGAIGAGGIGFLALSYGYNRFDTVVMLTTVLFLVLFTQVVQRGGDLLAKATTR